MGNGGHQIEDVRHPKPFPSGANTFLLGRRKMNTQEQESFQNPYLEKQQRRIARRPPKQKRINELGGDPGDWRIHEYSKQPLEINASGVVDGEVKSLEEQTLIGKFIRHNPPRCDNRDWILWSWAAATTTTFLPRGFFAVEFKNHQSRSEVLSHQIWRMGSYWIYIEQWTSNFNPKCMALAKEEYWIQLYNLPLEYWTVNYLKKIGSKLGVVLELDTGGDDAAFFARIKLISI